MPNPSMPVLLDAMARASLILAAAGFVTTALRRSSAAARHLMWVLGLVGALLVPAFSLALPRWEVPIVRVAATIPTPSNQVIDADPKLPAESGSYLLHSVAGNPSVAPGFNRELPKPTRASRIPNASIGQILLLLWAAGAAIVFGRLLLGLVAVWWMSRRTREVTDGPWLPLARGLAADLELTGVRFVQSRTASMPMAWGVLRGSVLMPADADRWPAHRLRVVLLHELAHVKRRDCLTHIVAQIVCAAYWFNPLVWIAARRLRAERERACDDLVLEAGTRGSDYADELLDIARVMRRQRFPAVLGGASLAMAHRSQLEGRLIAILDPTVPRRGLSRGRAIAAAGVCGVLMVSVASVQPWAQAPAAIHTVVPAEPLQATVDKPIEPYPGQAADVRANARAEDARQTKIQNRVQTDVQRSVQGVVDRSVDSIVSDTIGAVAGGVVGGVVDGVVDGVVGGVTGGVAGGVGASVGRGVGRGVGWNGSGEHAVGAAGQATPTPTPTPTPNPTPAIAGDRGKRNADPRAVAALMEALKDSDKEVRETAMHALVEMRDPRMFDPLVAALKDGSPDVREQAAFGLGQLRDPRAVEPLTPVLRDSNANVREQAVFALGQLRDKRSVSPLLSALKDENENVREQAAFALGQIRDASAVEALVIALKDGNADVRQQAAFALGQLRDPRAIEGLTAALKDSNVEVRRQAAFALGQIRY